MATCAQMIVESIIDDLTGRKGLRQEWGGIDDDIREEIRETWRGIAQKYIDLAIANETVDHE